jgi:hypothetical protein
MAPGNSSLMGRPWTMRIIKCQKTRPDPLQVTPLHFSFVLYFLNVDQIRRPPSATVTIPRGILMPSKSMVIPWQGIIGSKHNLIPQGISKQPKSLRRKVFTIGSYRICPCLAKAFPIDPSSFFLSLKQVNLANIVPYIE